MKQQEIEMIILKKEITVYSTKLGIDVDLADKLVDCNHDELVEIRDRLRDVIRTLGGAKS